MKCLGVGRWGGTLGLGLAAWMMAACSNGDGLIRSGDENGPNGPDASMTNMPDAGRPVADASSDATQAFDEAATATDGGQDAGVPDLDTGIPGYDASGLGDDAGMEGQDAGTGDVDGGPYGWGDRTDIEGIFQKYCGGCHGTTWQSCWTDQANERNLSSEISSGSMPRGTTMSSADKSAVLAWLSSGATCVGPYQDAGVVIILEGSGTSGAATPVGIAAPAP